MNQEKSVTYQGGSTMAMLLRTRRLCLITREIPWAWAA